MSAAGRVEVEAALAGLRSVLEGSGELVRAGGTVDLAGLEREAASLCDAVVKLPPPDARSLLPLMEAILAALDALEADLRRAAGGAEPDFAAQRQRAAAAYRKAVDPA
ncbi:MAG TPA: hypothetical protein VEB20_15155 [Azospirillaceae bacterium]|nr:hypothetical protein [Azospirillaceae bacterium]